MFEASSWQEIRSCKMLDFVDRNFDDDKFPLAIEISPSHKVLFVCFPQWISIQVRAENGL
jgi:hypothetical protein